MIILDWQAQKMIAAKERYKVHHNRSILRFWVMDKGSGLIETVTYNDVYMHCGNWCPDIEVGAAVVALDRNTAHDAYKLKSHHNK